LNKYFFDLAKLPELQWLSATTVSPGLGKQYHKWIGLKKKGSGNNKIRKFIEQHWPNLAPDEVELMEQLNDPKDFRDMARQFGYTDERIKADLS
jgi:hypothetical protein